MILRPSWKLMNMHLPIFTEVLCYNKNIDDLHSVLNTSNNESGSVAASGENQE